MPVELDPLASARRYLELAGHIELGDKLDVGGPGAGIEKVLAELAELLDTGASGDFISGRHLIAAHRVLRMSETRTSADATA